MSTASFMAYDMPAATYHATPGLGSTSVKTLGDPDISMAEAHHMMTSTEHKPAYDTGTMAHSLILEGDLDSVVHRVDADSWRTKAAKEERDQAYNDGLIPINNAEAETKLGDVYQMQEAVMSHPVAAPLLTDHDPEVSLFWRDDDVDLKARLDAYRPADGVVVDLKTIRSARPSDVQRQISDLGYHVQARHYLNGIRKLTGFEPDWLFVMVQSTAPYTVSVHRVADEALEMAQVRIDYALKRYKQATEANYWPGYEGIYEQNLTPWEYRKIQDLAEMEENNE